MKDIFGRNLHDAIRLFGPHHADSRIGLQDGVWLARACVRPDVTAQRRGAWKPIIIYAALDANGNIVSNGTRGDTIRLAKGCE